MRGRTRKRAEQPTKPSISDELQTNGLAINAAVVTDDYRRKIMCPEDEMRVTCPNCGGPHAKWDCKLIAGSSPAKKSTAARKDVPSETKGVSELRVAKPHQRQTPSPLPDARPKARPSDDRDSRAGTQALPVDAPRKRGRPRIHPDRKAYKAEHERARRARQKEQQK